jgi:fatty-acyl-CoA synthase
VVTHGYRNPQDNNAALLGGHLNSGDLAFTDEDGRIYIAGRAKDLTIRNGHNIDPKLIEQVLQRHPAVALAGGSGSNPTFVPGNCRSATS